MEGEGQGSPTPGSRLPGAHAFLCKVIEVGKSAGLDVWKRAVSVAPRAGTGKRWRVPWAVRSCAWRTVGALQVSAAIPSVDPDEEGRGWGLIPVVGSVPRFPHLLGGVTRAPGREGEPPRRGAPGARRGCAQARGRSEQEGPSGHGWVQAPFPAAPRCPLPSCGSRGPAAR